MRATWSGSRLKQQFLLSPADFSSIPTEKDFQSAIWKYSHRLWVHNSMAIIKRNDNKVKSVPMLPVQVSVDMKTKDDIYIMHTFDLNEAELQIKISYDQVSMVYEQHTAKKSIYSRNPLTFS